MDGDLSHQDALAMLEWQVELGVQDATLEAPIDRFALDSPPSGKAKAPSGVPPQPTNPEPAAPEIVPAGPAPGGSDAPDATEAARAAATAAGSLEELRAAIDGFGLCPLRATARQMVFADGLPGARVMIVGEAPGKDEDRIGKPFVGRAGQLLDRMFAFVGLSRTGTEPEAGLYITNMLPWRPPQNRDPTPEELSMLGPFVRRHIELADPDILVLMGNFACQGLVGRRGITRLRGQWTEALGRPALPMFHPAYLLRKPHDKAKAWSDLLSLQARIKEG